MDSSITFDSIGTGPRAYWDALAVRLGALAPSLVIFGPTALVAYILTFWLTESR